MKYFAVIGMIISLIACSENKVILLPEINNSSISKIEDISAAYLFYDETEKDSVDLNRKNLISSTNWLINVDKRLTLKQTVPHIKFLQAKKNNSSHKNITAKNYFTCNDTSVKNLGFIDFTNVVYHNEPASEYFAKTSSGSIKNRLSIVFNTTENIEIKGIIDSYISEQTNQSHFIHKLKKLINQNTAVEIVLNFNQNLSFQNYITIKSILSTLNTKSSTVLNHEFIFN